MPEPHQTGDSAAPRERPSARTGFERQVRDALMHLHDYPRLRTHPLARFVRAELGSTRANLGLALHDRLVGAIDALKPSATTDREAWRRYRILALRYTASRDAAAVQDELVISSATYYREHQRALEEVAALLSERWGLDAAEILRSPLPAPTFPEPLTSFVGRERELAEVRRLLTGARLVTLTGAPGTGKTRLAVAVAVDAQSAAFPDGVRFVPLAPIRDPELVMSTVAHTLGVPEMAGRSAADGLEHALRGKRVLLVLDNFEQVVTAGSAIAELLAACPRLRVLVTSRAVLHVSGEREFPVPPLEIPSSQQPTGDKPPVQYEAVQLFVERARDAQPNFAITDDTAAAVVEICRRLDGLPLAIELAAARIKVLPPPTLLARLQRRLPLLTGGPRDQPRRQQTLRATIDWSYDLLDPAEQALFRRLAVFAGGCTLEAAEAVGAEATDRGGEALDGLASLVDKSLLQQEGGADGEPRFRMLETIREYALERLAMSDEKARVCGVHASHFLALAEAAESGVAGPQQVVWLSRLETEIHNVREAWAWITLEERDPDAALRLVSGLNWFWYFSTRWTEARIWFDQALSQYGVARRTPTLAKALFGSGGMAFLLGDYAAADARLQESLAVWRDVGDRHGIAYAQTVTGLLRMYQGDLATARALIEESIAMFRDVSDPWGLVFAVNNLGDVTYYQRDYERARTLFEESYVQALSVNQLGLPKVLNDLAKVARAQGEDARARARADEALGMARRLGTKRFEAMAQYTLGRVAQHQGEPAPAAALFRESLMLYEDLGDRIGILECLEGIAAGLAQRGEPARAVQILGAAAVQREATGMTVAPADHAEHELTITTAIRDLGEDGYAAAWAAGRKLLLEQAVADALDWVAPL